MQPNVMKYKFSNWDIFPVSELPVEQQARAKEIVNDSIQRFNSDYNPDKIIFVKDNSEVDEHQNLVDNSDLDAVNIWKMYSNHSRTGYAMIEYRNGNLEID